MIVPDLLRRCCEYNPERVAVVIDGVGEMAYAGWERASSRIARALVARGPEAGQLDLPTLVITADGDTAVPTKHGLAIAAALPGSRHLEIAGCGHLSPEERPVEIGEALAGFFEEVWG